MLAQDRPVMGIVSGQGGASGQRERGRVNPDGPGAGRDVHIRRPITAHVIFSPVMCVWPETVTGKSALQDGTAFIPGGTLIVDQAELSLKETISCSMARCAITCRSCSPTAGSAAGPAAR
uniref:Multifunctional conjugation protein TraI n=1 Tax=Klebsiella pneumoniae TaxID=573 RepID=A0A2P1BP22_KLEPN|nr:Multifunctional conjugation protein TraI [Klebsiella pneumoniae]